MGRGNLQTSHDLTTSSGGTLWVENLSFLTLSREPSSLFNGQEPLSGQIVFGVAGVKTLELAEKSEVMPLSVSAN